MTGWRADLIPWIWGNVTALLMALSSSLEKDSEGVFGDCLLSSSLMQRTHKDGVDSYSPLLIPWNNARQEQTGASHQLESVGR